MIYVDPRPPTPARQSFRPARAVRRRRFRPRLLAVELLEVGCLSCFRLNPPRLPPTTVTAVALAPVVPYADHEPSPAPPASDGVPRAPTALLTHLTAGPASLYSPPPTGRLSANLRHNPGLPALSSRKGTRVRKAIPGPHPPFWLGVAGLAQANRQLVHSATFSARWPASREQIPAVFRKRFRESAALEMPAGGARSAPAGGGPQAPRLEAVGRPKPAPRRCTRRSPTAAATSCTRPRPPWWACSASLPPRFSR